MRITFNLEDNLVLALPYFKEGLESVLTIKGENFQTELKVFSQETTPDNFFQFELPIKGEITIEGTESFVSSIKIVKKTTLSSSYAFHFAPSFGWINDPNGMIYHNGEYHLFFQYNPVGREWNNMSWGHAVSKDLLNWEQKATALFPNNLEHTIFSGSAIEIEDKVYLPYTLANITPPQSYCQCFATTSDFLSFKKQGQFLPPCGEERDPRIFSYKGNLYVLLFEEKNTFALYKINKDFSKCTKCCNFSLPPLWECPDLYQLKDEYGKEQLFFTAADGIAHKAILKDDVLTVEEEGYPLFLTKLAYAGQSFSGLKETIVISWLRTENKTKLNHGVMSLPRTLTLIENKIHLLPPKALVFKAPKNYKGKKIELKPSFIAYSLSIDIDSSFTLKLGNSVFYYDIESGILSNGENKATFNSHPHCIIFYIDNEIVEVQDSQFSSIAYFEIESCTSSLLINSERECSVSLAEYRGYNGNT